MKKEFFIFLLIANLTLYADDIKTIKGKEYKDIQEVKVKADRITFVNADGPKTLDFLELPEETRIKYNYDPFEGGLARGFLNKLGMIKKTDAFSLSQLEEAKKKATEEKKLLGFVMMWDKFYDKKVLPHDGTSEGAALQFYYTFKDSMVLVFVSHETEIRKTPESVQKGFLGPDEGGFAPNMCVVSADLKDYIVEIPYGGKESEGKIRHKIFGEKIKVIKEYLEKKKTEVSK